MKTLLYLIAAVGMLGVATPANAAPPFVNQRRIMSYMGGVPVYAVYQIVGYNALGFPIYQWVTQPVGPGYGRSYRSHGYRNYGYGSYGYRPSYGRSYYGGHAGHYGHRSGHIFHGGGHVSHHGHWHH